MPTSAPNDRGQHPNGQLARKVWDRLSLTIRMRWWKETDYGDHPERASEELLNIFRETDR